MSAYRLPAGAVLIDGRHLDALRYAIGAAQRARRRNALPPAAALDQLAALVAPPGHGDTPDEPTGESDDMTTNQAAAVLGVSPRTVRRLASGLGGRLVGGRLLLDRQAVIEQIEGMTA